MHLATIARIGWPTPDAVQIVNQELHRGSSGAYLLIEPIRFAEFAFVHAFLQLGQEVKRREYRLGTVLKEIVQKLR